MISLWVTRLVGGLLGRLHGWFVGCSVGWWVDRLVCGLLGRLLGFGWWVARLVGGLRDKWPLYLYVFAIGQYLETVSV